LAKPIVTFEDFIKRVLKVIFWFLVLSPFILDSVFHFPIDLVTLTAKPDLAISFTLGLLGKEPFRTLFALTVFPGFTFVAVYGTILMGWVERKLTAKIQLRTGPMYAGKFEGILQNLADALKLVFKEIIIPEKVDVATFVAVPFALMAVAGSDRARSAFSDYLHR
jgi:NADH-quinone oxidoreductase subunit H